MHDIKIPLKSEGRSRAKILTEEAFRETRNYIKVSNVNHSSQDAFTQLTKKYAKKNSNERNLGDIQAQTAEIREFLNKVSLNNIDQNISLILKFDYNEELLENTKNLLHYKAITEKRYFELYIKIFQEITKIYNRKSYPSNPEMNFQSLMLKKCKEEFYNPSKTKITFPFIENEEEKATRIKEAKYGNVRLIGEFYLLGILPLKVINECFEFLFNTLTEFDIRCLCELTKKCLAKIYQEDPKRAVDIVEKLEDF